MGKLLFSTPFFSRYRRASSGLGMRDWQIAVLVIIIVIFVLILIVYGFLVGRRWWTGTVGPKDQLPSILYFVDLKKQLRNIPMDAMQPPITTGQLLRRELARLCGVQDESTMALSRVDEGNVLVELNLDELMDPANRLAAAYESSQMPFHASRHWIMRSGSPPPTTVSAGPATGGSIVPVPNIYPRYPNITTDTLVTIVAADYSYMPSATSSGGRIHATNAVPIETAMMGREPSLVRLHEGEEVLVDPGARSIAVQPSGEVISVRHAPVVRYCYENTASPKWKLYTEPFRLPAGRWCVRAEAATVDHQCSQSNSRVFTVDARASHHR
jgi:hypothetical protein